MKFSKRLIKGKLIKRYKRFFADINIKNEIITAHCPNTGSMMGLLDQNNEVWISKNNDPKRKLKYTLEIIKAKDNLVGVNTHLANKIVYEGLSNNLINEFMNSDSIKPEVYYNKNTRFDFLVNKNNQNHFIEVKNVTLFRTNNVAEFPDAVTSRGSKHIKTLVDAIKKGYKSYVLFLVQIQNIENFQIAKDIDKIYYENYLLAKKDGVQFLAYRCNIDTNSITIEKKLNIINE
jgi:sugar fermentation stimulation protein A